MKFLSSEKLSAHKYKTPEGYLICTDAILARTGKQTYRKNEVFTDSDDDSEIEVDRKAEEVFAPATLASFENKPITVEHPDENVGPDNYNTLSVGFVRDVRRGEVDGQEVMLGTLVITDAQTIEEIENGEHVELSCGYDCDIVDEDNPQQRNIRGNHIALCEQGRAGIARIVDSVKDSIKDSLIGKRVKTIYGDGEVIDELYKAGLKQWRVKLDSGSFIDTTRVEYNGTLYTDSVKDDVISDLERLPIKFRQEMKEALNKKAKLVEILSQLQDIVNRAGDKKQEVKEMAEKILKDLKAQFDIQENFIRLDSIEEETKKLNKDFEEFKEERMKDAYVKKVTELKRGDKIKLASGNKAEVINVDLYPNIGEAYVKVKEIINAENRGQMQTEYNMHVDINRRYEIVDSIKDVEPRSGETKEDFISRFMSETKEEYPDEKQRFAVANSYWERKSTKDSEEYKQIEKEIERLEKELDRADDRNNVWEVSRLQKEIDALYKKLKGCTKDSRKYIVSYSDSNTTYIRIVKAKSKLDAIKKIRK